MCELSLACTLKSPLPSPSYLVHLILACFLQDYVSKMVSKESYEVRL